VINVTLTAPQRIFLECAKHWTDHPDTEGIVVKGSDFRMAERLEACGLLAYVGHGHNIDESFDREYSIYSITDAGRELLASLEKSVLVEEGSS
jgi:hypothetical protein